MRIPLILLVSILLTTTAYGLESSLHITEATCDTAGNVRLTTVHKGGPLYAGDVTIKALHQSKKNVRNQEDLAGKWTDETNHTITYLTVGSISAPGTFLFTSTNGALSKSGNYTITALYFKDVVAQKESETNIITECPGKTCSSDIQCDFDARCNNDVCEYLQCNECERSSFNKCVLKCDDDNLCTVDFCNKGECTNQKIDGCCRTVKDCEDQYACTKKNCVSNQCQTAPVSCVSNKDKCVSGTCIEPTGCVYQTDKVCLEKENEKRKYFIFVNDPSIEEDKNLLEKIAGWFSSVVGGFFA